MHIEDPRVVKFPRPGPTSSCSDLLIPALATFGAWLLSIIWAEVAVAINRPAAITKDRPLPQTAITPPDIPDWLPPKSSGEGRGLRVTVGDILPEIVSIPNSERLKNVLSLL